MPQDKTEETVRRGFQVLEGRQVVQVRQALGAKQVGTAPKALEARKVKEVYRDKTEQTVRQVLEAHKEIQVWVYLQADQPDNC